MTDALRNGWEAKAIRKKTSPNVFLVRCPDLRVYVCQTAKELVHVQADEYGGDGLLVLGVLPSHLVHGLWNELQDEVQVDLVLLLPGGVEKVHELDNVAVLQPPHDLQLAVLKPLVLQHLLNGHHLAGLAQFGLVDHSKAAVPNDLEEKKEKKRSRASTKKERECR